MLNYFRKFLADTVLPTIAEFLDNVVPPIDNFVIAAFGRFAWVKLGVVVACINVFLYMLDAYAAARLLTVLWVTLCALFLLSLLSKVRKG